MVLINFVTSKTFFPYFILHERVEFPPFGTVSVCRWLWSRCIPSMDTNFFELISPRLAVRSQLMPLVLIWGPSFDIVIWPIPASCIVIRISMVSMTLFWSGLGCRFTDRILSTWSVGKSSRDRTFSRVAPAF